MTAATSESVEQKGTFQKNKKSARLVVRNLPFKCNEEDVHSYFSEYGSIIEVTLLRKKGRLVGCGFVQFDKKINALKALNSTSGKLFLGRPIIVDWAVPKNKFHAIKPVQDTENESTQAELPKSVARKLKKNKINVKEQGTLCIKEGKNVEINKEDEQNQETIFFKDVAFQATNDDLKKCAEEVAGPVEYAVVCIDQLTEHSKGTAFIKFKEKVSADKILNNELKLSLFGKNLVPFKILNKKDLEKKKINKSFKDKRNLYLIKEGSVQPGTSAAKGVSQADMNKRIFLEQLRSKTLRHLNKFISPTRIIIYNLPLLNFDNKRLLELVKKYTKPGTVITEARVIRNLKDFDQNGLPKSKGYGFVSFENHEDALSTLRLLNNNPSVFSERKRPIVAFSIEDRMALKIKEKRKESLKNKQISEIKQQQEIVIKKVKKRKHKKKKS